MGLRAKILAGLLLAITIGAGLSGCAVSAAHRSGAPDVNIFATSRVATVRIEMEERHWQFCLTHPFEESYVPADFWLDNELVPFVGVRTKGNSSLGQAVAWNSPRLPLCVDFNFFNRARSLHGVKKIFLNNGWSDPTLMREVLAYEIFASMGIPTPRASFVDLWVNGNHLGVYTMTEMVDTTFLRNHFADPSGNLYKPELVAARLDWTEKEAYKPLTFLGMPMPETPRHDPILYTNIGGAPLIHLLKALGREEMVSAYKPLPPAQGNIARGLPAMHTPRNRLEAMMLKTNENNPDHTALFRFLEVLNNAPDDSFVEEIEKVLDVDQVLRFIAVSAVIVHLDNYIGAGHNNYLYEAKGKFTVIPWDTNMAFGTFNQGIRKDGIINFYIDEPTAGPLNRYPLVRRLLAHPPYMERYRNYVRQVIEGAFHPQVLLPRIEALAEMLRPYVQQDTEMFYTYEDWERCLTEDLRPPDIFEGWMAGGPSPPLPFFLRRDEASALRREFGVSSLFELMARALTPEDIARLKECLTPETYELFLLNYYGPLKAPQPPRQPGFGPNSLGLKSFITARYESVLEQLDGKRPSSRGDGSGNGASMWMADMFGR